MGDQDEDSIYLLPAAHGGKLVTLIAHLGIGGGGETVLRRDSGPTCAIAASIAW